MRHGDKLHDAIARYIEAETAINACDKVEGSPEEATFDAVVAEITDGEMIATTAVGALAALRLANQELKSFSSGSMAFALVAGATGYFDKVAEVNSDPLRDGLNMIAAFPDPTKIEGAGFAGIYDALTACMDALSGVMSQPRASDGFHLNLAGKYLEQLFLFLNFERRRFMEAAEAVQDDSADDGNHCRLEALLRFKVTEADLTFAEKQALLTTILGMEASQ